MSSVLIIVIIVVLLVGLVSFAVISQSVSHAREKRNRSITALKTKARQLKYMVSGFPKGFLPRDISLLLQKNLLNVLEQLSSLEPQESQHKQDLQWIASLLNDTQRVAQPEATETLENPQQIKEAKLCLEELNSFVTKQEQKGVFNESTAENYRDRMKQMVLELGMDTYILQARSAEQIGKYKLAVLHLENALNMAIKEGYSNGQIQKKVNFLKQKLETTRELAEQESSDEQAPKPQHNEEETNEAWQEFENETDDGWKKKHAYD